MAFRNPTRTRQKRLQQAQTTQSLARAGGRVGFANTAALAQSNRVAKGLFPGASSRIGGGRGRGGGGLGLGQLFQRQTDRANAANLARFQEAKGLRSDLLTSARQRIGSRSNQAEIDIARRAQKAGAAGQADLVRRGFRASTLAPNITRDVARQTSEGINRERDLRIQSDIGLERGLVGDLAGVIERKFDNAPDPRLLQALAQSQGLAQGVGGDLGGFVSGNALFGFPGAAGPVGPQGFGGQGGFNQLPAPFQQAALGQQQGQGFQANQGRGANRALEQAFAAAAGDVPGGIPGRGGGGVAVQGIAPQSQQAKRFAALGPGGFQTDPETGFPKVDVPIFLGGNRGDPLTAPSDLPHRSLRGIGAPQHPQQGALGEVETMLADTEKHLTNSTNLRKLEPSLRALFGDEVTSFNATQDQINQATLHRQALRDKVRRDRGPETAAERMPAPISNLRIRDEIRFRANQPRRG